MEQDANQDLFKFVVNKCYATVGKIDQLTSESDIFFENQCHKDFDVNFRTMDGKFQIDVDSFTLAGLYTHSSKLLFTSEYA